MADGPNNFLRKTHRTVTGLDQQADANKAAAAARDADLRPIFEAMRDKPYREIAQKPTDRGIKSPRGGEVWNQVTVMRAMKRLASLASEGVAVRVPKFATLTSANSKECGTR